MTSRFEETIVTRERLRQIYRPPGRFVANKAIDHIDQICRSFIAACPFVLVATRGADGRFDLSPKGDPPGFVMVLDDKTLVIPDRLGNNRIDTLENLVVHPEVGLYFLIPGHDFTLRVSGTGQIVRDSVLLEQMSIKGRQPSSLLVVNVEEAFQHCAKSITRSGLWQPARWPDRSGVAGLAEAMVVHGALTESVSKIQAVIDQDAVERLY